MEDSKPPADPVSRAEFYQTAALAFLLPALLVSAAAGVPEAPLRQVAYACAFFAAVGLSVTFSVLGFRHRARRK